MISMLPSPIKKTIFFLIVIAVCIVSAGISYSSTFPFDEDTVFCSYFMISGNIPSEQDIEDLCFTIDKPAYTSFKPSEMFSKKSIKREKSRIEKKIKSIDSSSTLIWKVRLNLSDKHGIDRYFSMAAINDNMPQPTPYISSRISAKGLRLIKNAVISLLNTNRGILKKETEVIISLKPEKSEYGYQKRYIVEQDVTLPIRYVIFLPTEVRILDEKYTVE